MRKLSTAKLNTSKVTQLVQQRWDSHLAGGAQELVFLSQAEAAEEMTYLPVLGRVYAQ